MKSAVLRRRISCGLIIYKNNGTVKPAGINSGNKNNSTAAGTKTNNNDFNFAREGELVGSLGVAKEKVIFKAIKNSLNELVLKLQNEDYRTKFLEKHPNLQLKDQEPIKALHR